MFKLNKILKIINRHCRRPTWKHIATQSITETGEPSSRQKAWIESREIYLNYPHILYSSYIESQPENFNKRKQKYLQYKNAALAKYLKKQEGANKFQVHGENQFDMPTNWMEDYEFYEGSMDEDGTMNSTYGTENPMIPPSSVPCNGCGACLHCASSALPGYIPSEIFRGRTKKELQTIVCQRCHFLKNYNIALDVEVTAESYIKTIGCIKDKFALAIMIVDLLDFPCSIWPGMAELLGSKRPIFVVGNKVDLLPRDANNYLDRIKKSLKQQMIRSGFEALNIQYIGLISAKTGFGIEELITQLHKIWSYKGDVYLMGCTNVGKSTLFNILLNSDYCRPEATDLVRKATACPWPGTTLQMLKFPILRPSDIRVYQRFTRLFSERAQRAAEQKLRLIQAQKTGSVHLAKLIGNVGRTFTRREESNDAFAASKGTKPIITLNERAKEYQQARWCYDTPGVMHPDQITNLLTTEELLCLQPNEMISPRAVRLKKGWSLFLAGLGRLDFVDFSRGNMEWIKAFIFSSPNLPIVISPTERATEVYQTYLGNEILGVPFGTEERLSRWPGLECRTNDDILVEGTSNEGLACDIILSSAGWIGLEIPFGSEGIFKPWTPYARGIHMRTPPLIPFADRLIGKHVRNSLSYHLARPFVLNKKT